MALPTHFLKTLRPFILFTICFLAPLQVMAEEQLTKEQLNSAIREYLLNNPEIIVEMQQVLETKRQQELEEQQKQVLAEKSGALYAAPLQIEFGNPDAKHTIVEFFDYNCGFCQRALDDMNQLLESRDDVRFVLKEYPVLGEGSFDASRISLAVTRIAPDKSQAFHKALLRYPGTKDRQTGLSIAEDLGIERDEVLTEMEKPDLVDAIRQVYELADQLGITGTPSYVVGDQVIFGAVGYEQLLAAVGE
ncbi:MAG: DsbA family protein [Pseudomonadota bacterium]